MLDRSQFMPNKQLPLRVTGLCYRTGGEMLIDNLDLQIQDNGISVIMGPNGAGKSLLVRLLHGLLPASDGHISWNGEPCSDSIRAGQAMVFQKPVLLRRSVTANLDFALKLKGRPDRERRDHLLRQANLHAKARQPARALSGGEQQRLALARALATDPQVLFLDEPTASLDPASTQTIEAIIDQASRNGVKVILVTHDAGQARRLGSEVVFMHRGQVAEHSDARKFFDKPSSKAARDYLAGRLVI